MNKDGISLAKLTEQYLITCQTEGKTGSTLSGFGQKLGRFVRRSDDSCLGSFSPELARA